MSARPMPALRVPGLYIEDRAPLASTSQRALRTGVPAFVGLGGEARGAGRGAVSMRVLDRWDAEAFEAFIRPAPQSHLAAVVAGFFVNGGERCLVVTVAAGLQGASAADALRRALEPGGPLDDRNDIDLVCVPDAGCEAIDELASVVAIHAAAIAHCESMGDRFALLDAPPARLLDPQDPTRSVIALASTLRSSHGSLYHPWVTVDRRRSDRLLAAQPTLDGRPPGDAGDVDERPGARHEWRMSPASPALDRRTSSQVPPCGHVAGLVARIDRRVGPQHAPAHQPLDGVVDTSSHLDMAEQAALVDAGVNPLRALRRGGVEVGAARTLSGHSALSHVSTARVMTGFRRWLAFGLQDLVFEPDDAALRDRIRLRLVSQCLSMQAAGQIVADGSSPAFFIQCDDELNPPGEQAAGRIVSHVGLAPSVPAEYIVVRVMHDTSGITISGLS